MTRTKTTTPAESLTAAELAWLESLRKRFWHQSAPDCTGQTRMLSNFNKRLTSEEWRKLKELIRAHGLPVTISGGWRGEIYLIIYDHSDAPGLPAKQVLALEQCHIPEIGDLGPTGGLCQGKAYRVMTRLTNTRENLSRLELYGIEKPRERSCYDY